MATCLVFGASGAIGRFLLPRLLDAGHHVIAVSRTARASADARLRWVVGEFGHVAPLPQTPDVIFSLGPLDAFARWFAAANVAPARVIALGSMSVESKRESPDGAERELAERLRSAERELIGVASARGCAWTVFRPTLIYGAGTDRSLTPIARFALRWRLCPRLRGARGLRQPVHADDLAAACVAVLSIAATAGRTYPLGGGERLSFATMLERVRLSLPMRVLAVPIPVRALRAIVALSDAAGARTPGVAAVDRLVLDLVADNAAAMADFQWAPRAFRPNAQTWIAARVPASSREDTVQR